MCAGIPTAGLPNLFQHHGQGLRTARKQWLWERALLRVRPPPPPTRGPEHRAPLRSLPVPGGPRCRQRWAGNQSRYHQHEKQNAWQDERTTYDAPAITHPNKLPAARCGRDGKCAAEAHRWLPTHTCFRQLPVARTTAMRMPTIAARDPEDLRAAPIGMPQMVSRAKGVWRDHLVAASLRINRPTLARPCAESCPIWAELGTIWRIPGGLLAETTLKFPSNLAEFGRSHESVEIEQLDNISPESAQVWQSFAQAGQTSFD